MLRWQEVLIARNAAIYKYRNVTFVEALEILSNLEISDSIDMDLAF